MAGTWIGAQLGRDHSLHRGGDSTKDRVHLRLLILVDSRTFESPFSRNQRTFAR